MKAILAAAAFAVMGAQADAALLRYTGFQMSGGWMGGGFVFDEELIAEARAAGLPTVDVLFSDMLQFVITSRKRETVLDMDDLLPGAFVTLELDHRLPWVISTSGIVAEADGYSATFDDRFIYTQDGASRIFWGPSRRDYDMSNLPLPASGLALLAGLGILTAAQRSRTARQPRQPRSSIDT